MDNNNIDKNKDKKRVRKESLVRNKYFAFIFDLFGAIFVFISALFVSYLIKIFF
jgi:hypothetical protein